MNEKYFDEQANQISRTKARELYNKGEPIFNEDGQTVIYKMSDTDDIDEPVSTPKKKKKMGRPKNTTPKTKVHLTIETNTLIKVKRISARYKRTMSDQVTFILEDWIRQQANRNE